MSCYRLNGLVIRDLGGRRLILGLLRVGRLLILFLVSFPSSFTLLYRYILFFIWIRSVLLCGNTLCSSLFRYICYPFPFFVLCFSSISFCSGPGIMTYSSQRLEFIEYSSRSGLRGNDCLTKDYSRETR